MHSVTQFIAKMIAKVLAVFLSAETMIRFAVWCEEKAEQLEEMVQKEKP